MSLDSLQKEMEKEANSVTDAKHIELEESSSNNMDMSVANGTIEQENKKVDEERISMQQLDKKTEYKDAIKTGVTAGKSLVKETVNEKVEAVKGVVKHRDPRENRVGVSFAEIAIFCILWIITVVNIMMTDSASVLGTTIIGDIGTIYCSFILGIAIGSIESISGINSKCMFTGTIFRHPSYYTLNDK